MQSSPAAFSCYLWKKSKYYSKIPGSAKAWALRWCTIDSAGFRSQRGRGVRAGTKSMNVFTADVAAVSGDSSGLGWYVFTADVAAVSGRRLRNRLGSRLGTGVRPAVPLEN